MLTALRECRARQDKIKRKSRSNYSSFSRDQFLSRGPGLTAEALETGDDYDDYNDEDEEDDYGARGGGDEQDEVFPRCSAHFLHVFS